MQRASRPPAGALGIERVGGLAGARIDGDNRVQRRPLFVVGVDARQIELDQLPRRDLARLSSRAAAPRSTSPSRRTAAAGQAAVAASGRERADKPTAANAGRADDGRTHDRYFRISTTMTSIGSVAAIHVAVLLPAGSTSSQYALPVSHVIFSSVWPLASTTSSVPPLRATIVRP